MSRLARLLPFLAWFPLRRDAVRADVVAGVTVALVLVPQSMAYAQLAGLPPHYGLYTAFLPVIVGGLWGSSGQLATGPVAVVSLLVGAALPTLAAQGPEHYVEAAIALAFLVGCMQLALGALRLGFVVNFLSHPVITGFTTAAAIIIALSQLHKLLGLPMTRSGVLLLDVWNMARGLPAAHLPTLAFGLGALAAMFAFRRFRPAWPGVLITAAVATALSAAVGFERVVGHIPLGLPELKLPSFGFGMLGSLLATALAISLVGFMEAISIAKAIAARTRQRLDPNQELLGQGLANLAGCVTQCFPASGSFSRSAVNYQAGARSGLSAVVTGAIVMLTLLFLTPLLYYLPEAVLAAIIMMAVVSLVDFAGLRHAWRAQRHDGIAGVATFVLALALAPHLDIAIFAGAGLSVVLYLYRSMRPRFAVIEEGIDLVVVRFDGELYFANAPYFEDKILDVAARFPAARHILVIADGINQIDASGDEVVRHLAGRLRGSGVTLEFSGLRPQVLDVLRATGTLDLIAARTVKS